MKNFHLENNFYKIALLDNGDLSLQDKRTGIQLSDSHPFIYTYGNFYRFDLAEHCQMAIEASPVSLQIHFSRPDWRSRFPGHPYCKPDPGPALEFHFSLELVDDDIIFSIMPVRGLDNEELLIEFPSGLLSWNKSAQLQAIIPWGYGQLVDFPRTNEFFSYRWHYNTLPLYGIFQKNGGIGIHILTPADIINTLQVGTKQPEKAQITTSFIFNREFANYKRTIQWHFFPPGSSFVELSKWYRQQKIDSHTFVSLTEKIRRNPEVEQLVGAVVWKHSVYSQRNPQTNPKHSYSLYALTPEVAQIEGYPDSWNGYELFNAAHQRGFDRLCVYNTGWNHAGFDSGYPTRFPVNSERGTEKDFSALAGYARQLSPGFYYSVHDNYTDLYSNAEEPIAPAIRYSRDQKPVQGGIWRGGRAHLQCSAMSLKYARRDIPRIKQMIGSGSIYIDIMGSAPLNECYCPDHPCSRRDDLSNRRKFFQYVKSEMGSVASEAVPCDAFADLIDLSAYLSSALESEFPPGIRPAVAIPLWQLIYHDSVLCFTNAYDSKSTMNYHALTALFGLLPGNLDEISLHKSRDLRGIYTAEMTDFFFITPPLPPYDYAAGATFSNGQQIIANLTSRTVSHQGLKIPPHTFQIIE